MNTLLLNRDFQLPADNWYHVLPLGEFPHPSGPTQVFDAQAAGAMVAQFKNAAKARNFPGLLVDYDHFSHEADKPSEAAGWATDLQNRADGVWAQIRWSDAGEAAVKGGRYRLISPVVDDSEKLANSKRVRPRRLIRLALTNDPNLKGMVPLSNRRSSDEDADKSGTNTERKTMKSVSTLLGLSPDASEEAVHGEVLKLKNRATELEGQLTPLKNRSTVLETENKELKGTRVTAALEQFKNRYKPENKDKVQKLLENDYENALAILNDAPEAKAATSALHNRAGAKTPNAATTQNEGGEDASTARAHKLKNRAGQIYANNRTAGYDAAWEEAMREEGAAK